MAVRWRKTSPEVAQYATAHNDIRAQIGASSKYHLDASEVTVGFGALSGTDSAAEAAAIAAANQLKAVWEFHIIDTLAHKAEQAVLPTLVKATSLATAYTLANAIQTDFNAHNGDTSMHYNADSNNNATTVASTLSTLQALCASLKTSINTHMADAPASAAVRVVDA